MQRKILPRTYFNLLDLMVLRCCCCCEVSRSGGEHAAAAAEQLNAKLECMAADAAESGEQSNLSTVILPMAQALVTICGGGNGNVEDARQMIMSLRPKWAVLGGSTEQRTPPLLELGSGKVVTGSDCFHWHSAEAQLERQLSQEMVTGSGCSHSHSAKAQLERHLSQIHPSYYGSTMNITG